MITPKLEDFFLLFLMTRYSLKKKLIFYSLRNDLTSYFFK